VKRLDWRVLGPRLIFLLFFVLLPAGVVFSFYHSSLLFQTPVSSLDFNNPRAVSHWLLAQFQTKISELDELRLTAQYEKGALRVETYQMAVYSAHEGEVQKRPAQKGARLLELKVKCQQILARQLSERERFQDRPDWDAFYEYLLSLTIGQMMNESPGLFLDHDTLDLEVCWPLHNLEARIREQGLQKQRFQVILDAQCRLFLEAV